MLKIFAKSQILNLILAILTLVFIVSCLHSSPQPNSLSPSAKTSNFKVGMLLSGSKADKSWSQGGYEGLKLIEEKYQAKIAYQEYVSEIDAAKVMEQYAQDQYDLIIGHSGGYIAAAEKVAKVFPRTKFALITTYSGNNRNLGAVAFRSGEVGYLTGLLATLKTKTNKVGYMVGYDYPVYQEEAALFKRGVQQTNPNVKVFTAFLQTWTDEKKAQTIAQDWLKQGVDVFAINADEAGPGAIEVIVKQKNTGIIGWTKDQYNLAPNHVITSVLQNIPLLVANAAALVQQGRWEGKLYKFGLKENIYDFAPFRGALTPEQTTVFNQVKEKIISGEIDISPEPSKSES